jgi:hypothetical protein
MQKSASAMIRTIDMSCTRQAHYHSATLLMTSASQKAATSKWPIIDERANFQWLYTFLNSKLRHMTRLTVISVEVFTQPHHFQLIKILDFCAAVAQNRNRSAKTDNGIVISTIDYIYVQSFIRIRHFH